MTSPRPSGLHWALRGMDGPPTDAGEDGDYDVCAICHESLATGGQTVSYPCGHTFHRSCFSKYLEHANHHVKCPMCMQPCQVLEVAYRQFRDWMDKETMLIDMYTYQNEELHAQNQRMREFISSLGHTWNSSHEYKAPEDIEEDVEEVLSEFPSSIYSSSPPSPPVLQRTTRTPEVRNLSVEFDAEAGVTTRSRARMRNLANTPPPVNLER